MMMSFEVIERTAEVETHGVAEGYACVLHRLLRGAGFAIGKAKRPQCDSMPYPTYVSFISVVRKTRKP